MKSRVIYLIGLILLLISNLVLINVGRNNLLYQLLTIALVVMYLGICIKEILFLHRNRKVEIIDKPMVKIIITLSFIIGIISEIYFTTNLMYVFIWIINVISMGYILHNEIIVGDSEVLYRNKKIVLNDSLEMTIKKEMSTYYLLEVKATNKYRLSVRKDYLVFFQKYIK